MALVCLLALLGTLVLARIGGARPAAPRPTPKRAPTPVAGPLRQGNALRDGQRLDPNVASAVELELLPGVGPRLARDIVDRRARAGPFRAPSELLSVRGIGEKTLAKLSPFLRIDSERLEHAAQAQRQIGGAAQAATLDQQRATQVDPKHPASREQIVDAQHDMAADP